MLKKFLLVAAIVLATMSMAAIAPAYAQATRTWVSGVGDDANPCSRTAPCKTFAGAISKTAAKGEINCLDSGGFGAVTITKSITILCNGVVAGILSASTNGIIINVAATDRVVLDGLDIDGAGTGLDGVRMVGGGSVLIARAIIHGVTQEAVHVFGLAGARVTIVDSLLVNNNGGIFVEGNGAVANSAVIDNVIMDNNAAFALKVSATGTAIISDSFLAGSTASISTVAGASVISHGGNVFRNPGAATQTLPKQ